jgi:uncharacterized protein
VTIEALFTVNWLRRIATVSVAAVTFTLAAFAQERIPDAPRDHFNDYAGVVSADTRRALNEQLVQFERATSNQLIVAIFPKMESRSSVEDYTVRIAQAWGVGTRDRSNGAVLFAFMQERRLYIQVGYGLEGALPDALCKQIIENEILPRFRSRDFDAGFRAGVEALMAAARGEYRGTGRTEAGRGSGDGGHSGFGFGIIILFIVITTVMRLLRGGVVYSPVGRRTIWRTGGPHWGGGGGFRGGRSGGSFRGGGGRFGGGGAGGSW